MISRIAKIVAVLFLLVFLIFTTAVSQLEENGIAYDSLSISSSLDVEVEGFKLHISGFNLDVKKANLDLSFSNLLSGEFKGKSCRVEGVKIQTYPTYEEEEESEPFSYSSIPYIGFEDLHIANANIEIGDDENSIVIDVPIVHSTNFVLNDSIIADVFEYDDGLISVPIAEATGEENEVVEMESKFEIPYYIPKFKFGKFAVDSLTFITQGTDFNHKFSGLSMDIDGWSNLSGAEINLNTFQFNYQDTVHAEFDRTAAKFITDKSLIIKELNLDLPGLALRLNTFSIDKQGDEYAYTLKLDETKISPSLIKAFIPNDELIQETSPNIVLSTNLAYQQDTMWIHDISAQLGVESGFTIKGTASDLWNQQIMNIEISEMNVSSSDVAKSINYEMSEQFVDSKANLTMTIEGDRNQINAIGRCNFDDVQANLTAEINDVFTEKLTGDFDLRSSFVSSATFASDTANKFNAHGLSIRSEINESNNGSIEKMIFHLHTDSLTHQEYRMKDFEVDGNYFKGLTTVFLGDVDQSWRIKLSTFDNIFESNEIAFTGNDVINTIDLGSTKLVNGLLKNDIKGKFKFTDEMVTVSCDLDKINYTSDRNRKNYDSWVKLNYAYRKGNHTIELRDKASIDMSMEFNDDLFEWLGSEDLSNADIPDFKFQGTSKIDSAFIHDFIGLQAGANLEKIDIEGKANQIQGEIQAPYLAYESNEVQELDVDIKIKNNERLVKITSDSVLTDALSLSQVESSIDISKDYHNFDINLDAFAEEVDKKVKLNSTLIIDNLAYTIRFEPSEIQHFGSMQWKSKTHKPLQFRKEDSKMLGEIDFYSNEQSIKLNMTEAFIKANIAKLNIGAAIEKAISDDKHIESILNFDLSYNYSDSVLKGKGAIDEIVFDSINVGSLNIALDADNSKQKASIDYRYLDGFLNIDVLDYYTDPIFFLVINQLDLASISNDFHLLPEEYDLSGKLNAQVSGVVAEDPLMNGEFTLDSTTFSETEYGVTVSIINQKIGLKDNHLHFDKFKINDAEKNDLFIDGDLDLFDPAHLAFEMSTDRFMVLNNLADKSELKGEFGVKSKLKLVGNEDVFKVSGFVNALNGNRIEYFYGGDIELNDMSSTVSFVPFNAPVLSQETTNETTSEKEASIRVQYDVNVDVGNTELYVLLSKGKNEYFQVTCNGELNVTNGENEVPEIFGSIRSTEGNIYYETPAVSKVDMEIREASAKWTGDLFNPEISFIGEETFLVTPREMSTELSNNSKRVPVVVKLEIKNKTLDDFDIEFDISSEDQSVQGILAPLTEEERSTYAMSMLVYGKINSDGDDDPYIGYQQIVDKLNEISRRNFNETELSFHIASESKEVTSVEDLYNNLGYNFSKKLFHDDLKITIGGSLDLDNSGETNSKLLETIKVEYNLLEKPDLNLHLSRDNTYKGPIEGQVDQSSVGVSVNFEFDNLFKRKNTEKDKNPKEKK